MVEATEMQKSENEPKVCLDCHREIKHKRLNLLFLIQDALAQIFTLERGLFYTWWMLLKNPKDVIDNFVKGDRYRYINPFRFLFLSATLYALTVSIFGISITQVINIEENPGNTEMMDFLNHYSDLLILSNLPLLAFGSWAAFRYKGYNYAEHLVVNSYALAIVTITQIPIDVFFSALIPSIDPYWETFSSVFMLLIFYVYISSMSNKIIPGILRTFLAFLITMIIASVITIPLGILYAMLFK